MPGKSYVFEVKPKIPEPLASLYCLANDLSYSWHSEIRDLFISLDKALWEKCDHNPKIFLRRVAQKKLDQAAQDKHYIEQYHRVLSWYHHNQKQGMNSRFNHLLDPEQDLIAYFCSEFGFHESLPIYSGGLGILAGDHCKAASDLGLPFVAVGLLYHQGYFSQTINPDGQQVAKNVNHYFGHLPVTLLKDNNGEEIHTQVQLPHRQVVLRIWHAKVGRVDLYLLDSDVDENTTEDRSITRQLYGDGHDTRIKQEIILGIGGVKALRKVGLAPNIWHINEGHAAFQILERSVEYVSQGMEFDVAIELVAGSTVFTTHTPVAAGHDSFSQQTMVDYFSEVAQHLGIEFDKLLSLGISPEDELQFNMTALALRGSRFHNGVSKIHGEVASKMEQHIWPEIPPKENPIGSITNGVHVASILAKKWVQLFDEQCADWRENLMDERYWHTIESIPNYLMWDTHQELKASMMKDICQRLYKQHLRNDCSKAYQEASVCHLKESASGILIMGFARRFATYKRATLLFSDIERLSRLLNNPERPVMILFAGKAHPSDEPGQNLIREIYHISERPEFVGKIILLEDYNLAMARRMIAGTDVWLNTPIYPLEACGTSGQKAAINGVVNLSVMDGWWAEGYNGENGWSIAPHTDKYGPDYRNQQEASDLLDIIEHQVIPSYFERDKDDIAQTWLALSKASMKSSITHFSAQRMVQDYIEKRYVHAKEQNQQLAANDAAGAKTVAEWKNLIRSHWQNVQLRVASKSASAIYHGDSWSIRIGAYIDGLSVDDIVVECLKGHMDEQDNFIVDSIYKFDTTDQTDESQEQQPEIIYSLTIDPEDSGIYHYKLRAYPYHPLLSHKFETGYMRWL